MEVAFGKQNISSQFKAKVIAISGRLGCDPSHLMAAMAFETGERFRSNVVNKISGAMGLIQFMPKTAKGLGTTTDALATMSEIEQLDYVEAYLKPYAGRVSSVADVYMTILWPAAVGKPAVYALFSYPGKTYEQNKGLDANKDGVVTKAEAAVKVYAKLVRGVSKEFLG